MKVATYSHGDGQQRLGVLAGGLIHGCPPGTRLPDLLADPSRLRAVGQQALTGPAEVVRPDEVTLDAPVPAPPSMRDFIAFEQHLATMSGRDPDPDWYQLPVFYFSNPAAVTGPDQDIPVPPGCQQFDYELEVAAVIGRPGRNLSPAEAERHIAGYMVLCDFSARDIQAREMRLLLGPAKGKDTATSCGPYLVTPDELEPHRSGRAFDLEVTAWVNGRQYSSGNLNTMYWSFAELVAYASRGTQVLPGDIIGSGTVGGGCIAELAARHGPHRYPWLQPGDEVVIEVAHLGRLTHRVVPGPPLYPLRPEDPAAALAATSAGSIR
jgi:2-keto-4-pentenoate hydratase/2-oxohepta-3-ene-1,7-dioic acid hydratase in catechol pathway